MKKSILYLIPVFFLFSCKKTYTCECTLTASTGSQSLPITYSNITKKNAKSECQNSEDTYNNNSGLNALGGHWSCEVK